MKIFDIHYRHCQTIEVRNSIEQNMEGGELLRKECFLRKSEATSDILLQIEKQVWNIEGITEAHHDQLEAIISRNLPRICWISGATPKKSPHNTLLISLQEFFSLPFWEDSFEIGVDERIAQDIQNRYLKTSAPLDKILEWFREKFLLEGKEKNKQRFFLSAGTAKSQKENSFRLHGVKAAIDVRKDSQNRYTIHRVSQARFPQDLSEEKPVYLLQAKVEFKDITIVGQAKPLIQNQLDELVARSDSYLKLWENYNEIEKKNILELAKEAGWGKYSKREALSNGSWRFFLEESEAWDRINQYGKDLSWEALTRPPKLKWQEKEENEERVFIGDFVSSSLPAQSIDLRAFGGENDQIVPPTEGYLAGSLRGDQVRLQRRQEAVKKIMSGQAPMPQLGLLLEEQPVPKALPRIINPLTSSVRRCFSGGEPNSQQVEALRLALRTCDIFLIQGPPGTGKTKVISALCTRLAEYAKDNQRPIARELLLTSYQHDAVDNMASRTEIYGIPAIRVGRKGGNHADFDSTLTRWQQNAVEKIQAELTQMPSSVFSKAIKEITQIYIVLSKTPQSISQVEKNLKEILEIAKDYITDKLRDQLRDKIQYLEPHAYSFQMRQIDRDLALLATRRLRTSSISFGDDGQQMIRKFLVCCEDISWPLSKEDLTFLQEVSHSMPDTKTLQALQNFKNRFLDQLNVSEIPRVPLKIHEETLFLIVEIINEISQKKSTSREGIGATMMDYIEDIQNDPIGVRKTLLHYATALAATAQQTMGKEMKSLKEEGVFDTVIVDEAARANPLDMIIPMSMALRRIILVGDHRQLPHLLEPKVEKELRKTINEETKEALQKSLFERLFCYLKELEKKDGITRVITLNVQYRMHPILGDFISQTFYEYWGEPKVKSGTDPLHLAHHIAEYDDKVAIWIDVPATQGAEKKKKSICRPKEAKVITEKLTSLLKSNSSLSFGVISFYRAQVDELWKDFTQNGLAKKNEEGEFEISPSYLETKSTDGKIQERLRLGTVDSFQGKEFDVVILSLTRSNQEVINENEEERWARKYGFLLMENRLNVAMSRAKRLLIVVGDSQMVRGKAAQKAVRGLADFWKLTGGEYGLRI